MSTAFRLRRRSWLGRAIRVPRLTLAYHRAHIPWPLALRLALVMLLRIPTR